VGRGRHLHDTDDICTTDLAVSAPCTKAGSTASLANICGNDNPADCTLDTAKVAGVDGTW